MSFFPGQNEDSLNWLVKEILPILNESDEKRIFEGFKKAFLNKVSEGNNADKQLDSISNEIEKQLSSLGENSKLVNFASNTKDFLKTILEIPFSDEPRGNGETKERIEKHLIFSFSASWHRRGVAFVSPAGKQSSHPDEIPGAYFLRMVEELATRVIIFNFASVGNSRGKGFDRVGMCPNCGIFFEKKRKDQEGCSKTCNNNIRVKRFRKKSM